MSSRLTARAKALSFIFFSTPFTSTSRIDLVGLTSAHAVRKPASSSQANSALSRCESGSHAGVVGMGQDRVQHRLRPALLAQRGDADKRMLLLGGMPFVVHIVEQAGAGVQRDKLRGLVAAESEPRRLHDAVRLGAHRHRQAMLAQALALGPLLQQLQRPLPRMLRSLNPSVLPAYTRQTAIATSNADTRTCLLLGSTLVFFRVSSGIFGSTP